MTTTAAAPLNQTVEAEYYDMPTLIFHWLTVLFVIALFGTSLVWNYVIPHDRTWRPLLESTHVSLGILFAVLIMARLAWRLTGSRRLPAEMGLSGALSRIMYLLLYALLAVQVVLGFMLRWYQGDEFGFFGLFTVPALFAKNAALEHPVQNLHNWTGWAIVILSVGHALAALVHHYFLKDLVWQRMAIRRHRVVS